MTAGTFLDGNTVHMPDVNGFHASIPARVVHLLRETARNADNGRAKFGLRWFDRDDLTGAADLLDARNPCDQCHDAPGTQDMGDGNRYCDTCCSGAQGSRYDDKEEF